MGPLRSFFHLFLSPAGVGVLGALDSSLVFFLPFGVDAVIVALVARNRDLFWLYPLLATAGSVVGAAITFYIGRRLGEPGLARFVDRKTLARAQRRVRNAAALSTGLLALIPPPFPFTGFVLASGALDVSKRRFFGALALARLARFGAEAVLARRFGERITAWLESPWVEWVVGAFVVLAIAGTIASVVKVVRSGEVRVKPTVQDASTEA